MIFIEDVKQSCYSSWSFQYISLYSRLSWWMISYMY